MSDLRFLSKMDGKGRVTLPQTIREGLGLYPGTYFEVLVDIGRRHIILKPVLRGMEEGVIAEVVVRVKDLSELTSIIGKCVSEGYDIMRLNCIRNENYECVLNIYAIDVTVSERLREVLGPHGIVGIKLLT